MKRREVFTKIGGCWNNGKCMISFFATFPSPPLSCKQGEKHKIWQLLTKSWMFWARCCRSCDLASWVSRWAFYSHISSRLGLLVYSFSHCCNKHALIAGCFFLFFFSSLISPFQLSFPFFNQQIFMEHLAYEWYSVRQCLHNDNPYFIEFIVHTNCMPIFL